MVKEEKINLITTKDGSHSLEIRSLHETYHSIHGALQESTHVFIKNGMDFWLSQNRSTNLSIFEVGFGTGLNALLTLKKGIQLHLKINYNSIELYPLNSNLTNKLNYAKKTGCNQSVFQKLHTSNWDKPTPISPQFNLYKIKASFQDTFINPSFDIIYYDAFAPSKQPEMWNYKLIKKCFAILNPNGVFVTYSAKGQLKRDLKQAGFHVESLPGFSGKLEMVRATKKITPTHT